MFEGVWLVQECSRAIRETCSEKKIATLALLSEHLSVSKAYAGSLLNGHENLTLKTMAKIALALGKVVKIELVDADAVRRKRK